MKKQQEHESLVQATFQPRILQHPTAQSRLKILSDPDSYLPIFVGVNVMQFDFCVDIWIVLQKSKRLKKN